MVLSFCITLTNKYGLRLFDTKRSSCVSPPFGGLALQARNVEENPLLQAREKTILQKARIGRIHHKEISRMNELTTAITAAMTPLIAGIVDVVTEQVMNRLTRENEKKEPRYYTAQQVAEVLHVSLPTVRRMSSRGDIIPLTLPNVRGIRYDAEKIEAAIAERKIFKYKRAK